MLLDIACGDAVGNSLKAYGFNQPVIDRVVIMALYRIRQAIFDEGRPHIFKQSPLASNITNSPN
jgi:hypothetical protein